MTREVSSQMQRCRVRVRRRSITWPIWRNTRRPLPNMTGRSQRQSGLNRSPRLLRTSVRHHQPVTTQMSLWRRRSSPRSPSTATAKSKVRALSSDIRQPRRLYPPPAPTIPTKPISILLSEPEKATNEVLFTKIWCPSSRISVAKTKFNGYK